MQPWPKSCVNAFMHKNRSWYDSLFFKYQNHNGDTTYNSVWLGMLTMGLGLHNNHHHNPSTTDYAEKWYEVDLSRFVVPILRKRSSESTDGR